MYDTLIEWDYDTLKPKPGMAKWAFPDAKTMVLNITTGITFHDGTPMDAEAVKFDVEVARAFGQCLKDRISIGAAAQYPLTAIVQTRHDARIDASVKRTAWIVPGIRAIFITPPEISCSAMRTRVVR